MIWPLQDAKNKFSELVETAITAGPQMVTKRGQEAVVVISVNEFRKLSRSKIGLLETFSKISGIGEELDLSRLNDLTVRDVIL